MWQKFKEQIPSMVVIVAVLTAIGAWMYNQAEARQDAALEPLREQNEALRAQADANQRQLEATSQMLRDAVARRDAGLFNPEQEVARLNGERIDALATAIAQKVVPQLPGPKTMAEVEQMENDQADRISSRIAERMEPGLTKIDQDQQAATNGQVARDRVQIQSLNNRLLAADAAAQDALKLSHEISAEYLNTFNDQGVLVRVLSLPAFIMRDAATGNLINSRDHDKVQQQLDQQMQELEKRLNEIQSQAPVATNS